MRLVTFAEAAERFKNKSVAIVGSAPSVLENAAGFVDSHDIVVRVNNYKLGQAQGFRTDVHASFYGSSIRKTTVELRKDGVTLCLCKCPNGKPLQSDWHEQNGHQIGVDFRYIYTSRAAWWFCDIYIPTAAEFMAKFEMLGKHIPTTGFAAIMDVVAFGPRSIYLTGFDFFASGVHNVDEPWRPGDPADPIGHRPELERAWIAEHAKLFMLDARLEAIVAGQEAMA